MFAGYKQTDGRGRKAKAPVDIRNRSGLPPPSDRESSVLPPPSDRESSVLPPPSYRESSVLPPPEDRESSVLPPPADRESSVLASSSRRESSIPAPPPARSRSTTHTAGLSPPPARSRTSSHAPPLARSRISSNASFSRVTSSVPKGRVSFAQPPPARFSSVLEKSGETIGTPSSSVVNIEDHEESALIAFLQNFHLEAGKKYAQALWNDEGNPDDNELPLTKGEVLEILDTSTEGWWFGRKLKPNGSPLFQGLFPSNLVKEVESEIILEALRLSNIQLDGASATAAPAADMPGMPEMPDLPDLPALPDLPDLPGLPDLPDVPGPPDL